MTYEMKNEDWRIRSQKARAGNVWLRTTTYNQIHRSQSHKSNVFHEIYGEYSVIWRCFLCREFQWHCLPISLRNENEEKCKRAVWERRIPITPQKRAGHLIATPAVEIAWSKGWASAQGREAGGGTRRGKALETGRKTRAERRGGSGEVLYRWKRKAIVLRWARQRCIVKGD